MNPLSAREKPGKRRALQRWLLATGILLALLLLAEVALRLLYGLGTPVLVVRDSACEYVLKPNQNLHRFSSQIRTNRYGMRSDEFSPLPAAHTLRVMFLGDSSTFGTGRITQSNLFTEILHRELPAVAHQPVEVLNASVSGWAIDNELSYLQSRGSFHSNVVALVLNSGDIDQQRATQKEIGDGLSEKSDFALHEVFVKYLLRRWRYYQKKLDPGERLSRPDVQNAPVVQENLRDLDTIKATVEAGHARLILIYTPFQIYLHESGASEEILGRWCREHGVAFFDMTPYQARYSAQALSLNSGAHLNTLGHRVVADGIKDQWVKNHLSEK
jgi:lysophospholipase L1-like esterase